MILDSSAIVAVFKGEPEAGDLVALVEIVPFDREQADLARSCYLEFGKGSGSPAQLSFGDCFSYALAMTTRQPLLFKGDDFRHTDVTPASIGR